jgi:adenine deaminase
LVVKNAKIVNVLSGEVHEANVAIAEGIFVGFEEKAALL